MSAYGIGHHQYRIIKRVLKRWNHRKVSERLVATVVRWAEPPEHKRRAIAFLEVYLREGAIPTAVWMGVTDENN
jgi:hypothetical protein